MLINHDSLRFVGNYFNEGLYDEHINLKQVPMLPWDPPVKSFRLTGLLPWLQMLVIKLLFIGSVTIKTLFVTNNLSLEN